MRRALGAALVVLAVPAAAQSPFDGTWRIDLSSIARAPRTEVLDIRQRSFACLSCDPTYRVPIDGGFHPVQGQDDVDETMVRILDARTIERTNRWKGRLVRVERRVASPDGASAAMTFTDTINPGVAPVSGSETLTRLAPPTAGAHVLSGSWQHRIAGAVSESALLQTFRIVGDVVTMTTGEGFSYTARMDGTPAPARGDPLVDTVSVRRIGERESQEVDSGKGRVVARFTYVVAPDGRTLTIRSRHEKTGRETVMTARRR